jgi:tetratricopeptide (TPR) repeat protein
VVLGIALLAALLIWGEVDRSLAGLLPTPTPVVTPSPTPAPGQIVAQFVPQLEAALSSEDWDRALEIAAIMDGVDPGSEEVRQWALATHLQYGQALVGAGEIERALGQFDQAVALAPDDADAQRWQQTTQLYLVGQAAFAAGDWPTAIQFFVQAHQQMPDYGAGGSADLAARVVEAYRRQGQAASEAGEWDTAIEALTEAHERLPADPGLVDLLSAAHRQRGIAWQQANKLQEARADLETALAFRPDDAEARAHYDEVMYILFPPKRIEIDISKQHFYAWLGDTLIYSFPTSTGLRGRDTATGHYKVLDKIPMAYSSVWNLKMPYWLGIYYVGNIENGIHALPIRPDGSVMWAGLLGQRASYGCVILSTQAAKLIYDWAEIGTKVDIHY